MNEKILDAVFSVLSTWDKRHKQPTTDFFFIRVKLGFSDRHSPNNQPFVFYTANFDCKFKIKITKKNLYNTRKNN